MMSHTEQRQKDERNIKRIEQLYVELETCYFQSGCDHEKATSILNSIIERKSYLTKRNPNSSAYVDFKKMISHYVLSMKIKEHDYDEINISQLEKKISKFTAEQKLHLYDMLKRELILNGYSEQAERLKEGYDQVRLKVYKQRKGLKSFFIWLSFRISYQKRYLFYWLILSFVVLVVFLIPNESNAILRFSKEDITENSFWNHIANVLVYIFEMDSDVTVKPLNFGGVILMFFGKAIFILFVINFLIRKIFDKTLK